MKHELNHEQAFIALGAAAVDALDTSERDAILAHVSGCSTCRAELESLRATATNLAFAAPLAADSRTASRARIRDRITARATAESQARRIANPPLVFPKSESPAGARAVPASPARSSWAGWAGWVALAAVVLLGVALAGLDVTWRERNALRDSLATRQRTALGSREARDSLLGVMASRDSLLESLTARDLSVLTLTSRTTRGAYARLFWDRARDSWTVFARNLPPLRAGRTYQLWIITSRGTVSAGTFDAPNGSGVVSTTYAVDVDMLRGVAVTEEATGGAPRPTSDPIIAVNTR